MYTSALKSDITQLCTFLFTFTFVSFYFEKKKFPTLKKKKPTKILREKLPRKEASMGCVRETPHVNHHWACKRNSPFNPGGGGGGGEEVLLT